MTGPGGRRWPLRLGSTAALIVALAATVGGTVATHSIVHDQEHRLLKERTAEVGLVLSGSIMNISSSLHAQGGILRATDGSRAAYTRASSELVASDSSDLTFGWLRRRADGSYLTLAAAGDGLHRGEVIRGARTGVFDAAMHASDFVATNVFGPQRRLGFAIGQPTAPPGTIVYREIALGPVKPPSAAGTAPFAEVDVALYGGPTADPATVLTATTRTLPLRGDVNNAPLQAGESHWLISLTARHPLVGSVAADSPWFVLAGGVVGSVLIAAVIEIAARRRDAALALYSSEHQMAETLQRSLLPELPAIEGVTLAARYLAAGPGQEVGGDWFDAFPLSGGRVGVVIGDVMGHDLAAASAMAQIRAGLRAYAIDGDPPATVMNRLQNLVTTLDVTPLVTVIYGILEAADPSRSRRFRYTNAGHLPPLLRGRDGKVRPLASEGAVVIGAPVPVNHSEAECSLEPGSTLILFTDGLVEVPRRPLEQGLDRLAMLVTNTDPRVDAEALCDGIVASAAEDRRDDIALLALQINAADVPRPATEPAAPNAVVDSS